MKPTGYKIVKVVPPQVIVDNTSWTANVVDTLGFRFLEVYVHFGAMDIAMAALKLQESDVAASATALTSGADITGAVFGTSTNDAGSTSTLPSASSDNGFFKFEIDLKGRKRHVLLVATGGDGSAGTYMTAFALLHNGEQTPTTTSQKGCDQILRVPVLS